MMSDQNSNEPRDSNEPGDQNQNEPVVPLLNILTEDEMLMAGLKLIGWEEAQVLRVETKTNHTRFVGAFGALPHILAKIWEVLQTTSIEDAKVDPKKHSLDDFLCTMHFLYRYPTEIEGHNLWKRSRNTTRKWTWFFVHRIRALKLDLFRWPANNFDDMVWVASVDGTHFRIEEPSHPDVPKDPGYYSFKHHCAGFNYEIALSLTESKVIWFSGPWEAGTWNDIKIFREKGLAWLLRKHKKMVIADNGYRGYANLCSTPNSYDAPEVAHFKSRARCRQESYNGKLKNFECLSSRFRHSKEHLQACFEAVAVIVQYKMDGGEPLYDI